MFMNHFHTAELNVFSKRLDDQISILIDGNRVIFVIGLLNEIEKTFWLCFKSLLHYIVKKMFETIILRNKISFCIRFSDYESIFIFSRQNQTFFRFSSLFFNASSHSRFAEDIDRFFHITFRKNKRFFALSHTNTSSFAQFSDHLRGYFLHYYSSFIRQTLRLLQILLQQNRHLFFPLLRKGD